MDTLSFFTSHDIKPSIIRIMIYDLLKGTKAHPGADEIYSELLPIVPTLSRTSVYNTLKLFSEKGIIKTLSIEGERIRYDAQTKYHGHFLCNCCRGVYDFELSKSFESGLEGFDIQQREVFYTGCCPRCKK